MRLDSESQPVTIRNPMLGVERDLALAVTGLP
jgi:hypothetical protein